LRIWEHFHPDWGYVKITIEGGNFMKEVQDKFVSITCSKDLLKRITVAAFDNRISRSKLIRNIIEKYLNDREANEIEGVHDEG
jgi:hypothetical protein